MGLKDAWFSDLIEPVQRPQIQGNSASESQPSVVQELIQRCTGVRQKSAIEASSTAEAVALQNEICDFLLILGSDYQDIRTTIAGMSFVRHEQDSDYIPALREVVDFAEVQRAEKLLAHVIHKLPHYSIPVSQNSTKNETSKAKPGPKRREHEAIAKIVRAHGYAAWKDELDAICAELDGAQIPVPKAWKNWPSPVKRWEDALDDNRGLVIKSIEHTLKVAPKPAESV